MGQVYSTREIAELLGTDAWRVRRLYELGVLEEPPRLGGRRIIPGEMIPQILSALRERGWLPGGVGQAS